MTPNHHHQRRQEVADMARANVLSTAFNLAPSRTWLSSVRRSQHTREGEHEGASRYGRDSTQVDPELKLPPLASLIIVLMTSGLLQVCHHRFCHIRRYLRLALLRFPSSLLYPRPTHTPSSLVAHQLFLVLSSVSPRYSQVWRSYHF